MGKAPGFAFPCCYYYCLVGIPGPSPKSHEHFSLAFISPPTYPHSWPCFLSDSEILPLRGAGQQKAQIRTSSSAGAFYCHLFLENTPMALLLFVYLPGLVNDWTKTTVVGPPFQMLQNIPYKSRFATEFLLSSEFPQTGLLSHLQGTLLAFTKNHFVFLSCLGLGMAMGLGKSLWPLSLDSDLLMLLGRPEKVANCLIGESVRLTKILKKIMSLQLWDSLCITPKSLSPPYEILTMPVTESKW